MMSARKFFAACVMMASFEIATANLIMSKVGGYANDGAVEEDEFQIVAVKPSAKLVFAASNAGVTILELDDELNLEKIGFYDDMSSFGEPTSVAYSAKYDELAISVKSSDPLTKGKLYIVSSVEEWIGCNLCEEYMQDLEAGFHPDMVTFTPNGKRILIANEGEPVDYTGPENDPVGSVSIYTRKRSSGKYEGGCEVGFTKYDRPSRTRRLVDRGMRIGGMDFTTFSMDVEPEFIAVTENSRNAYVTLQENNAVAKIGIKDCKLKRVYPLGYKQWGDGLLFDASDEDDDEINVQDYPSVKGMYMPDAIKTFKANGARYFVTANEGDSREYGEEETDNYFTDEIRVRDLAESMGLEDLPLYDKAVLGRLKVTTQGPYDGDINELYAFGGRSISIFDGKTGELVWDSGDFIATYTADPNNGFAMIFNSDGDTGSFDDRSDARGSEPEGLVLVEIDHKIYVFVALERIGGWMCWDISDPTAPEFQSYVNTYNDETPDTAPESGEIIPAEHSPTGNPLLVGAYEGSNTIAIFELTNSD